MTPEGTSTSTWVLPTPRMLNSFVELKLAMVMDGAAYWSVYKSKTPLSSIIFSESTDTESAVVCGSDDLFCAVTTISSSASDCAYTAPPAMDATHDSAIAEMRFNNELPSFIGYPPRLRPFGYSFLESPNMLVTMLSRSDYRSFSIATRIVLSNFCANAQPP